jgi:AcrR family transcriptional regulator
MVESARPRRRYESPKRRAQAERTRARVVEAATQVFLEHGYVGATIPQIAAKAGVAVETVYRAADGKANLLEAAVQAALAGGPTRATVPVEQRPGIQRVIQERDPRRQLAKYAATQPGVWSRVGPLLRVLEAAAASDVNLQALRDRHARQRRTGMRALAGLLADRGALNPGLSVDRAADILWTLCAQANYDALVTGCGWTHTEYRDWLAETLARALLE